MIIEETEIIDEIIEFMMPTEALEFFKTTHNHDVDIILLDINMPRMNGFEFLEAYDKIDDEQKARAVVIMLTTSTNPTDLEKAQQYGAISKFMNKPLTTEDFLECINNLK